MITRNLGWKELMDRLSADGIWGTLNYTVRWLHADTIQNKNLLTLKQ
jgi:hypothetical protein